MLMGIWQNIDDNIAHKRMLSNHKENFMKYVLMSLLMIGTLANANVASWYGGKFHGKRTASGEIFDQDAFTAASNTHKFGTKLKVTNRANGKSVIVKVNDRGGFSKHGRTLDLSRGAFNEIASTNAGTIRVDIEPVE